MPFVLLRRPELAFRLLVSLALLVLALVLPHTVEAQISADRPGFGDGTTIVSTGTLQVEGGYRRTEFSSGTRHDIGELLVRYGLLSRFELRAGFASYALLRGDIPNESGVTDLAVGAKLNLVEGSEQQPPFTGVATITFPTAPDPFGNEAVQLEGRMAFDYPVAGPVGFSGNLGYGTSATDLTGGNLIVVTTLATSVADVPGLGLYGGYAGFINAGLNQNYVEGGVTYLVGFNTQVDINFAIRVDRDTDEGFFGAGLAHRF